MPPVIEGWPFVSGSKLSPDDVVELLSRFPVADELAERFAAAGHRLYLVGGSVRDALLGRLTGSYDLDFTTDARPPAVQQLLSGWAEAVWDTGIAFGTVGAAKRGLTLEITTFRADTYDGVTRNPEVTFGDTIGGDLVRRDFTANAMAFDLVARELVDPTGGRAALDAKVLDTPATPEQSFSDDPLRMLRAARFVSQLGFGPAPRVVEAMRAMAGELARITPERVQAELSKLLTGAFPRAGVELMVETGLADVVLPELPAMKLEIDEHHQHK
ncbi:MAG: CCA tRNA nucleotidyltransferase, partial [Saccharothrix sp.]|nr:CCA tRNA nucleotidyltransferase [Saccharothrix sp.]